MPQRSFTVLSASKPDGNTVPASGGRYISSIPYNAVKKAFSRISKETGQNILYITIKETTRGSTGKEYIYKVTKEEKETSVTINGEEITFRYTVKVKSV